MDIILNYHVSMTTSKCIKAKISNLRLSDYHLFVILKEYGLIWNMDFKPTNRGKLLITPVVFYV
jgi:hypothetical protein